MVLVSEADDKAIHALGDVQILFEDNHLLALNKPSGLLTQSAVAGDDNLVDRAREYLRIRYNKPGNVFVGLVHRLDRNVSGVVLLARTSKAAGRLSRAFADRKVDKRYLAVVEGEAAMEAELRDKIAPRAQGRGVERRSDGKQAVLRYRRLGVLAGRSLLEVILMTGRKHQIRAQLAWAGLPLVGDPLYGSRSKTLARPALHAQSLTLEHPVGKSELKLIAGLPDEVSKLVDRFSA